MDYNYIGGGPNGPTHVYVDKEHPTEVAIKWIPEHEFTMPPDHTTLQTSCLHKNIVQQYKINYGQGYVYQVMEKCDMNLATYIMRNQGNLVYGNRASHGLISILRDIINGMDYLHQIGLRCPNLKPENILIKGETAKLDPVTAKMVPDPIWQSPEEMCYNNLGGKGADLFRLGIIIYYCLSGGSRPFRSDPSGYVQDINIGYQQLSQNLPPLGPEASALVESLLQLNHKTRPYVQNVFRHPFFWSSAKRLNFITMVSEAMLTHDAILKCLRKIQARTLSLTGERWKEKVISSVYDDVRREEEEYGDNTTHLVRFIRNAQGHRANLSQESMDYLILYAMESEPEDRLLDGIQGYFEVQFPKLLMAIYNSLRQGGFHLWSYFEDYYHLPQ